MPPSEQRLERLVAGVVGIEGEVVAEHDEAPVRAADQRHQVRQALDVLAVDLDQLERPAPAVARESGIDRGVRGLHQRRLAHAARAPQQRVVGGQALGEALGVFHQHVAHALDALEQRHLDAVDAFDRRQPPAVRMPDEGVGGGEVGRRHLPRRQPLQRGGDALQQSGAVGAGARLGRRLGLGAGFGATTWVWLSLWPSGRAFQEGETKCAALSRAGVAPASRRRRKRPKNAGFEGDSAVAIGRAAAIVRANLQGAGAGVYRTPAALTGTKPGIGAMFITPAFAQGSLFGGGQAARAA